MPGRGKATWPGVGGPLPQKEVPVPGSGSVWPARKQARRLRKPTFFLKRTPQQTHAPLLDALPPLPVPPGSPSRPAGTPPNPLRLPDSRGHHPPGLRPRARPEAQSPPGASFPFLGLLRRLSPQTPWLPPLSLSSSHHGYRGSAPPSQPSPPRDATPCCFLCPLDLFILVLTLPDMFKLTYLVITLFNRKCKL